MLSDFVLREGELTERLEVALAEVGEERHGALIANLAF